MGKIQHSLLLTLEKMELFNSEDKYKIEILERDLKSNWNYYLDCKLATLHSIKMLERLTFLLVHISDEEKFKEKNAIFKEHLTFVQEDFKNVMEYGEIREYSITKTYVDSKLSEPELEDKDSAIIFTIIRAFQLSSLSFVLMSKYNNSDLALFYLIKARELIGKVKGALAYISINAPKNIEMQSKGGNARARIWDNQKAIVRKAWGSGHKWRYIRSKCAEQINRDNPEISYRSAEKWLKEIVKEHSNSVIIED